MKQPSGIPSTRPPRTRKPAPSALARSERTTWPDDPARTPARDEAIRRSAYGFYEARGRVDGHELEDWLRAEAEAEVAQAQSVAAAGSSGPASH